MLVKSCEIGRGKLRLFRGLLGSRKRQAVIWSGRWESNPRPKLGKLLYCHCTTPARFGTSSLYPRTDAAVQTHAVFRLPARLAKGLTSFTRRVCSLRMIDADALSFPGARRRVTIGRMLCFIPCDIIWRWVFGGGFHAGWALRTM